MPKKHLSFKISFWYHPLFVKAMYDSLPFDPMVTVFVKKKEAKHFVRSFFAAAPTYYNASKSIKSGKAFFCLCLVWWPVKAIYKKATLEKGTQEYYPPFAIAGNLLPILNIPSRSHCFCILPNILGLPNDIHHKSKNSSSWEGLCCERSRHAENTFYYSGEQAE